MISAEVKKETMQSNIDQEAFWQAVASRNASFDGSFVFAVSTTGIYCRPSCPARRPRREHVTFFERPEAAEVAGFRACRRCHPEQSSVKDPQIQMVQQACRLIEENPEQKLSLDMLSMNLGFSSFHLQRTFKQIMGITPRQYAESRRLNAFRENVRRGESIATAMYGAGYGSSSRLYERANAELGMTPATYRRGGSEMSIDYAIVECAFGYVLVAGTELGICSVRLGDKPEELERELRRDYAAAEIHENDESLATAVESIVKSLDGKQPRAELPLDIRATAFQRQVWEALRAIPYGETRSYSDIAKAIGRPQAVRAVARACATNPVALVIPCHRVIREDKSLGGYRWGVERKKKLLAHERGRAGKNRQ